MSVTEARGNWYYAKRWCLDYGTGWYLPSIDELKLIYNNRSIINATLGLNGYKTYLSTDWYWSSDEYADYGAEALSFSSGGGSGYNKYDEYRVRAVLAFEN